MGEAQQQGGQRCRKQQWGELELVGARGFMHGNMRLAARANLL